MKNFVRIVYVAGVALYAFTFISRVRSPLGLIIRPEDAITLLLIAGVGAALWWRQPAAETKPPTEG